MWSSLHRLLSPTAAFCQAQEADPVSASSPAPASDAAPAKASDEPSNNNNNNKESKPEPAKTLAPTKPVKKFKPLPVPGPFQSFDRASQKILGVLHQQDDGCQVVVSKQMTPFLAVVHDFNIGVEQYIPKQMGASIYTFRTVLSSVDQREQVTAQVDWFGRLNATYTHKWSPRGSTTLVGHCSNTGQGETTSAQVLSDYTGKDFNVDVAVEAVSAPGHQDVSLKTNYMQSLTQNIAAGLSCKVGVLSKTAEAKACARVARGASTYAGAVGIAIPAAALPLSLSSAQLSVTRKVTPGLELTAKGEYGQDPRSGQHDIKSTLGWSYSFRDRMISGALTSEGKIMTHFVQMMGSMRWGLTASVTTGPEGESGAAFGCQFEVVS